MQRERLKEFPVICAGTKKRTVKIQKRKYEISYLSKKEYREKLDETEHSTELLGYTTLKQSSIKKNAARDDRVLGLLTLDNLSVSAIEQSKRKYRTVKGYISVGYNRYVAIEKHNPLFILLFLLLGLLCISAALGFFRNNDNPKPPWFPVFEEIVDSEETAENIVPDIISPGFTTWYIPAGKTQKISTYLTNPDGNPGYFEYKIYLKDTGELLYKSDMVKPGNTLKKINLNKALNVGNYDAVIHVFSYEPNTGEPMNSYKFKVKLIVR